MYKYIWSLCSILFVEILADSVHSFAAKNGMLFVFIVFLIFNLLTCLCVNVFNVSVHLVVYNYRN